MVTAQVVDDDPLRNLGAPIATLEDHEGASKGAIELLGDQTRVPADIVNLRRARKAKARTERERRAAENRAAFGRTKEEKARTEAQKERAEAEFNRHRREPGDSAD